MVMDDFHVFRVIRKMYVMLFQIILFASLLGIEFLQLEVWLYFFLMSDLSNFDTSLRVYMTKNSLKKIKKQKV